MKLWGHYTTRDFVYFQNEDPVLFPDSDADAHGVYSGSAFVEDDTIHYFYTGNVKYFDRDDYDYIMSCHVRDPKIFKREDGYYMVPGAGADRSGRVKRNRIGLWAASDCL